MLSVIPWARIALRSIRPVIQCSSCRLQFELIWADEGLQAREVACSSGGSGNTALAFGTDWMVELLHDCGLGTSCQ